MQVAAAQDITAAIWNRLDTQCSPNNIIQDSGRFWTTNKSGILYVSTFSATFGGIIPYATNNNTGADGGKFTHNNSTFGGSGAALNADMTNLINAQGALAAPYTRATNRYGPEFNILAITNNATTGIAGFSNTSAQTGGGIFGKYSAGCWVAVSGAGSITVGASAEALWVNGVATGIGYTMNAATGWKHVLMRGNVTSVGYNNTAFRLDFAAVGTVLLMALPAYLLGDFGGYIWCHPVLNAAATL